MRLFRSHLYVLTSRKFKASDVITLNYAFFGVSPRGSQMPTCNHQFCVQSSALQRERVFKILGPVWDFFKDKSGVAVKALVSWSKIVFQV